MDVPTILERYKNEMQTTEVCGSGTWLRLDRDHSFGGGANPGRTLSPFLYLNQNAALSAQNIGFLPVALFSLKEDKGWLLKVEGWKCREKIETIKGTYKGRLLELLRRYLNLLPNSDQQKLLGSDYQIKYNHLCGLVDNEDGTFLYSYANRRAGIWNHIAWDKKVVLIVNFKTGRAEEPNGHRVGKSSLRYNKEAKAGREKVLAAIQRDFIDYDKTFLPVYPSRPRYLRIHGDPIIRHYRRFHGEFWQTRAAALSEWDGKYLAPYLLCDLERGHIYPLQPILQLGDPLDQLQTESPVSALTTLLARKK